MLVCRVVYTPLTRHEHSSNMLEHVSNILDASLTRRFISFVVSFLDVHSCAEVWSSMSPPPRIPRVTYTTLTRLLHTHLFGQNFRFVLGGLSRCFNCSIPRARFTSYHHTRETLKRARLCTLHSPQLSLSLSRQ